MNEQQLKQAAEAITKEMVDKGLIVEAGWRSYEIMCLRPEVGQAQRNDMRLCFFAGAQHLFGSIMSMLDPSDEPTEKDLARIALVDKELTEFIDKFSAEHGLPRREVK